MGTVVSFNLRLPPASEAGLRAALTAGIHDAVRWLHRVDAVFSTYRPDSEISRLARGELSRRTCSAEVVEVLDECAALERGTAGFFSPRAGGALDPSGFVKGWAVERASDILVAAGSTRHCVNGGGDVQCVGAAADGRPWRIGLADPRRSGRLLGTIALDGLAVATSGTAERGEHVLDPHTGCPPEGLASVTVVGPRLGRADALATAAFAMGGDAEAWLATVPGHSAYGLDASGRSWVTGDWNDRVAPRCR